MSLHPEAGTLLTIDGLGYRFAADPDAADLPFRQIGRCSTVYRLQRQDGGVYALKVPIPAYRAPSDQAAERLSEAAVLTVFAALPGLRACQRTVFTACTHASLLWYHPELADATLMPWVEGLSWQEVVLGGYAITLETGHSLARALALTLALAEINGLTHCDLSGSNVLLPDLKGQTLPDLNGQTLPGLVGQTLPGLSQAAASHPVELVDLDGMYAPGMTRQATGLSRRCMASGTPGYAHKTTPRGAWGPLADRFAAAILLAEMLTWGDAQVRLNAHGKQYFDPDELQASSDRYHLMVSVLRRRSGEAVAEMFRQAWFSPSLADCPPLVEWARLLEAPLADHLAALPALPLAVGQSSLWPASPLAAWPASPLAAWPAAWLPAAEHTASLPAQPDRETPHSVEVAVPAGPLVVSGVFFL